MAMAALFLVLQAVKVVENGWRHWVDPHWHRGMSYFRIGHSWIHLSLTEGRELFGELYLCERVDPEPAMASRKQADKAYEREFIVLKRFPLF